MSPDAVVPSVAAPTIVPARTLRGLAIGFAWAALSVTIFAGWFVVTRFSVTHELRIWDIMALRFGVGALLLLPVLFSRRHRLPPGAWREGFLFALLWGVPFVLLVGLGLKFTSAAQAASITPTLMPVCAGLFGWLIWREPAGRARLVGYLAILAGLSGLVADHYLTGSRFDLGGVALLILGAAMWAIYTLRFRRSGVGAVQATALICFWSALCYLPIYLALGLSRLGDASAGELAFQTIYQGVLMSAVGIVAFNRAVALLGSRAAAAIIALLPGIATAMAIPALGEIPSSVEAVAILVVAVGVIFAARPAASPLSPTIPSPTIPSRRSA